MTVNLVLHINTMLLHLDNSKYILISSLLYLCFSFLAKDQPVDFDLFILFSNVFVVF